MILTIIISIIIFAMIWYFWIKKDTKTRMTRTDAINRMTPTSSNGFTDYLEKQKRKINNILTEKKQDRYNSPYVKNYKMENYKPTMNPKNPIMAMEDFDYFSTPQNMNYNKVTSNTSPIVETESRLLEMARHQPPHPVPNFSSKLQRSGNYLVGDLPIVPRMNGIYEPLEASPNDINRGYFNKFSKIY